MTAYTHLCTLLSHVYRYELSCPSVTKQPCNFDTGIKQSKVVCLNQTHDLYR